MIYTFLIFVSILGVLRVIRKIYNDRQHITRGEFRAYMDSGRRMTNDERSKITSHLGICNSCRDQVEDWIKGDNLEDSLIED